MRISKVLVAVAGLLLSLGALAAATVESVTGDVRAGNTVLTQGAKLEAGATVTTGEKAQVLLRMDDGASVILHQNTQFRVVSFTYNKDEPKQDRSVFDLLRGAARYVTGVLGQRNPQAFALRVPQATIGIRGTDFMVALVNPAYFSVLSGTIGVTSSPGTVAFGTGSIGSVASSTTLGVVIPASALPPAAASAFSALGGVAAGAGGAALGASGATGAAGTTGATAAAIAAGAIAVGAAAASSGGGTTTTRH